MPGTTTRWAMSAAWSISPTWSSTRRRDGTGNAPLPGRDRLLLELHPGRRRAAHAGAAALLQARLLALHARLPVPALRVRRHRRTPFGRLAGNALRHPAHAGRGPGAADRRAGDAVGARP